MGIPARVIFYLCTIKAIGAILLLAVYLLSSTELGEFMKLPVLVSHYLTHKHQDNQLSFFGFMEMHYSSTDHAANPDDAEDTQLPFKSHNTCAGISAVSFLPTASGEVTFNCPSTRAAHPLYEEPAYTSLFLSSVWQPPKQA